LERLGLTGLARQAGMNTDWLCFLINPLNIARESKIFRRNSVVWQ
jgi:hypothetical protein